MNNSKDFKIKIIFFGFLTILVLPPSLLAQKKQTVGDYLSRLEAEGRGKNQSLSQKSKTNLPQIEEVKRAKGGVDFDSIKPLSSSEAFYSEEDGDEATIERLLDKQMRELFKLTQKFKDSPNRGELWLRLAELYVEKASLVEMREQKKHEARLLQFSQGKLKKSPVFNDKISKAYNKKAIELYEYFVRDFPRDPKMDQALFFLGFNHFELGDVRKGAGYYTRLTNEYPRSPYVDEADFALGDYYFDNSKWTEAYNNYIKVVKKKNSRMFYFSLYKAAWCLYRMGRPLEGLRYLENLIKISKKNQGDLEGKKKLNIERLESESLRDIVVFYAAVGNIGDPVLYFKNLVGDEYPTYIERLGYYYSDKGEREPARSIFKELIKINPLSPKAFDYQYQIVSNYANLAKSEVFNKELFAWIQNYKEGSRWFDANSSNTELMDNSYKLQESTLRNYVLQHHQTAQNTRAEFSQDAALSGYAIYLAEFKKSPSYADMKFFHGELLFDMGQHQKAAAEYRWVAQNGVGSKYYDKAFVNLLLSLEKTLPSDEAMSQRVGKSTEPVEIDKRVVAFIAAAEDFINKNPNDARASEIKFRIGRLYYLSNHFDKAETWFMRVITEHPKSKQTEFAANLLLDIYNLKNDTRGLERMGKEILAIPSLKNSRVSGEINDILEKVSFKQGQELEAKGDFKGAGEKFQSFAQINPTSSIANTAWFNAGVNFEKAGDIGAALVAYSMVMKSNNPQDKKLQSKVEQFLPKMLQETGQYKRAADSYVAAAAKMGNSPEASNYYYNAALLYDALEETDKALLYYDRYNKTSKSKDRHEVFYLAADAARSSGSLAKAFSLYKEYINYGRDNGKLVESYFWMAQLKRRMGEGAEADRLAVKAVNFHKQINPSLKGEGAVFIAELRFEKSKALFQELKALKIPKNPARQQQVVQQKIQALTRLNQDLQEVIRYDSPREIVSALGLLGQANQHMYDAIMEAPIPDGLSKEETDQYKAGVKNIADPFYKKAMESYTVAVNRGQDLDVYSDYYQFALDKLKIDNPGRHYDEGEIAIRTSEWSAK